MNKQPYRVVLSLCRNRQLNKETVPKVVTVKAQTRNEAMHLAKEAAEHGEWTVCRFIAASPC